jgi:hypothetical protein
MAKTFGAMVFLLPWEKYQTFLECMDLEGKISKIEADKLNKKTPKRPR